MDERTAIIGTHHRGSKDLDRGLAALVIGTGVATLVLGVWSFTAPQSFFEDFPISGMGWVSALGPFNEHLVTDFGAAEVGLAVAAIGVGRVRSASGALAVLWGFFTFGILHLTYHLETFSEFSVASATSQAVALTLFVIVPAVTLAAIRRSTGKEGTWRISSSQEQPE